MSADGDFNPIKLAFAGYMNRWYRFLMADTKAMQEYIARGFEASVIWAPDRMVDAVDDMVTAYQRNSNGDPGEGAKLPIVFVAMAKDYLPAAPDWGRQLGDRRMIHIENTDDASVYGYRQSMAEIRTQVAIVTSEGATARSLASQLDNWFGAIANRGMSATFEWGQYTVQMPMYIELPDVVFQEVKTGQKNMTILAGDLNLRVTIPYFDAPLAGEPNDGTDRNPPGYPLVTEVDIKDESIPWASNVTAAGVVWRDPRNDA